MTTPKQYSNTSALPKSASKSYGRIVLTLKNCLLPENKLSPTPSQIDGLDQDTEIDLRILGCELIQTAGILLKLPQVAMATAQVLFQRFYYSKSFVRHAMETTAMGCLCLASKIEEAPRRIRDVINVLQHVKQVKGQRTIQPIVLDQNYIALKTQVIKAERRVLKELGFCVHVRHPHKIIVMYLQVLGFLSHQSLMQNAWNYMNDSLRTDVFVRYQPETVACACIYLTSRKLSICLPKNPAWFSIFGVLEKDIKDVCFRILRLYQRAKPNAEELEKRVEELRRFYQEARLKARVSTSTGNTSSSQNFYSASGKRNSSPQSRNGSTSTRSKDKHHNAMSPRRNSHTLTKHRSRSRSRTSSRSPHSSKYTKKSRKKRTQSMSRSRSQSRSSYERKGKKTYKSRHSYSRSPSLSPHKHRRYRREKSHYRSRSRSRESRRVTNQSRSPSYEHYEPKNYIKSGHRPRSNKHSSRGTERDSRERERVRNKDRK